MKHGANNNVLQFAKRRTPLFGALFKNNIQIVRLLLENGSDPNLKDVDGNTSLTHALHGGRIEIVKVLLDYGAHHRGTLQPLSTFGSVLKTKKY